MYKKPKLWDERDLDGHWLITYKIDGVRMLRDEDGAPVSRNGKPLYNLDHIPPEFIDCEVFLRNWETSVSMVRTHNAEPVPVECLYTLDTIDPRLVIGHAREGLSSEAIKRLMAKAVREGYEGLVLHEVDGARCFKVKPRETYDVLVTGATEGKGKYVGLIGALVTERGKVSGMTDDQRKAFTRGLPKMIEVACMGLTKNGKFRHPRFIRERFDK